MQKKNKSINHNHGGYYKTLYYYGCNNNRKCNGRVCDFSHTYNQEKVDGAVFEIVSGLTMLPVFRERVLHHLGNMDVMDRLETELKKLRKTIRSEEMKKRKLGEDLDNLNFLDNDYDKDYEKLQGEIDRVYDRIEKAEAEMERKMKKLSVAKQGIQAADRIEGLLEHMGKNYNVSKKTDARVPVCPKDKEGFIVDALKYYKMLDTDVEMKEQGDL